jgi:hypothetical protein
MPKLLRPNAILQGQLRLMVEPPVSGLGRNHFCFLAIWATSAGFVRLRDQAKNSAWGERYFLWEFGGPSADAIYADCGTLIRE